MSGTDTHPDDESYEDCIVIPEDKLARIAIKDAKWRRNGMKPLQAICVKQVSGEYRVKGLEENSPTYLDDTKTVPVPWLHDCEYYIPTVQEVQQMIVDERDEYDDVGEVPSEMVEEWRQVHVRLYEEEVRETGWMETRSGTEVVVLEE